jgi:hypothetical protein
MSRFNCAFDGHCTPTSYGIYQTVDECEVNCQAREYKDLNYLIYEYAPTELLDLAPQDLKEVVRRLGCYTVNLLPPKLSGIDRKRGSVPCNLGPRQSKASSKTSNPSAL